MIKTFKITVQDEKTSFYIDMNNENTIFDILKMYDETSRGIFFCNKNCFKVVYGELIEPFFIDNHYRQTIIDTLQAFDTTYVSRTLK